MSKCFCHFNGLEVKDAKARKTNAENANSISALTTRLNGLVANNGEQTEGNAELIDIRTGVNGKVYATAGEAVREQIGVIATLSRNVYNPTNERQKLILTNDGSELANANYKVNTEYIPIAKGNFVSFYGNDTTLMNGVQNYCLYDNEYAYIGRYSFENAGIVSRKIDNDNAKYIRFSVGTNAENVMIVIDEAQPNYTTLPFVPFGNRINDEMLSDEIKGIVNELNYDYRYIDLSNQLEKFGNAYITSNGVITGSSKWEMKRLLISEIPEYRQISIISNTSSKGRYQIAFYSEATPTDETFISGKVFDDLIHYETIITEIPENAVSLLVTNLISEGNIIMTAQTEKASTVAELEKEIVQARALQLKEQRAKFDNQFNYIAYSSIYGIDKGPNSESLYLWAGQRKFTAIKGDVRISSDNEIVMCHDSGFTLNDVGEVKAFDDSNNTSIRTMTAEQCFSLVYEGTNDHVCGIDALIRTCKLYGKIAYITIRQSYMDEILPKIFASLDKYNMRSRTIINSFYYESLKKVRKYDANIMLSYTMEYNQQMTRNDIDMADALGNCLITCFDYSGSAETKATNQIDDVISYAIEKDIRLYEAQIGYDTDLNASMLIDRGFTGAQIAFDPEIFNHLP